MGCKHRLAVESFRSPWLGNFFFQCQIWFWQLGISRPAPTTPFPHRFTSPRPPGWSSRSHNWSSWDYYAVENQGQRILLLMHALGHILSGHTLIEYCICPWAYSDMPKKFSLYCKGTFHSSTAASSEQPALIYSGNMRYFHQCNESISQVAASLKAKNQFVICVNVNLFVYPLGRNNSVCGMWKIFNFQLKHSPCSKGHLRFYEI